MSPPGGIIALYSGKRLPLLSRAGFSLALTVCHCLFLSLSASLSFSPFPSLAGARCSSVRGRAGRRTPRQGTPLRRVTLYSVAHIVLLSCSLDTRGARASGREKKRKRKRRERERNTQRERERKREREGSIRRTKRGKNAREGKARNIYSAYSLVLMHAPLPSLPPLTRVCRNCSLVRDESNTSSRSRIRCYLPVAPFIPSYLPPLVLLSSSRQGRRCIRHEYTRIHARVHARSTLLSLVAMEQSFRYSSLSARQPVMVNSVYVSEVHSFRATCDGLFFCRVDGSRIELSDNCNKKEKP